MNNLILIRWWFYTCVLVTAGVVMEYFNLWQLLWYTDHTKISFLILGIFALIHLYLGLVSFRKRQPNNLSWYATDLMVSLGLIGTVIGFMLILSTSFSGIDASSVEQIKKAIGEISDGMGVALSTTLTGLMCAAITRLQIIHFDDD